MSGAFIRLGAAGRLTALSAATSQGGNTVTVVGRLPHSASMCARVHELFTIVHIEYLRIGVV
eukprot:8403494-Pyramimonas_sp.AAC.1